ncbi:MAG: magnesium transporter [Betaproteobacteria bacterium]|nr:magnesium transporter [Gammaproteobacteria bacterium]MDH3436526.1 magnesium transporter [Betaproteobacteria bacterium]
MSAESVVVALEKRYLQDFPREAARKLERLPAAQAAQAIENQPPELVLPVFEQLAADVQERLIERLPEAMVGRLFTDMDSPLAAELLLALEAGERSRWLARMEPTARKLVEGLMAYPPDTAGRLMDPRVTSFRGDMTAGDAIERMRSFRKNRAMRELFLVDNDGVLSGRLEIQDLALAPSDQLLSQLARPVTAAVLDAALKEEVVEKIEQQRVPALPVVSVTGRLVGVIHQAALLTAVQEDATLDIQTMVGASKDERALSHTWFAVIKRLPWLQINLATAFLAAAVVGLFETTIAKFTALAVLLPVVAGQSGNAGAQALAVTMRGLALREISARHLLRVVFKEINVGLLNGLAVAAVCSLGVWVWSGSFGLVVVIASAMVIAMVAAGFSGAAIPIVLNRMGFDPAQSSSIVLTTVTDVVGFFSFLGIATWLQAWL